MYQWGVFVFSTFITKHCWSTNFLEGNMLNILSLSSVSLILIICSVVQKILNCYVSYLQKWISFLTGSIFWVTFWRGYLPSGDDTPYHNLTFIIVVFFHSTSIIIIFCGSLRKFRGYLVLKWAGSMSLFGSFDNFASEFG